MQINLLFSGFVFLFISIASYAQQQEIKMVAGLAKPPFIVDTAGAGSGMQLDIIRSALSQDNIKVEFVHFPLGRNITSFQQINADGVITLPADYQHPALHLSQPYITYQNVAVSLADNKFSIKNIADVSGKNVMAFQNARKFLGDSYSEAVAYLLDYRELDDQQEQIEMLFLRRTEVIILDINIFKYFIKNHQGALYAKPYTIHYIFDERNYAAGFHDEDIRDKFDLGIKRIKANGSYQMILDNYLN